MSVNLAVKLSFAASVFLVASTNGEAALPRNIPSTHALLSDPDYRIRHQPKPKTALEYACEDLTVAASDEKFFYLKSEKDNSAYKMSVAYFQANYNKETQIITYDVNTPRVLCPI